MTEFNRTTTKAIKNFDLSVNSNFQLLDGATTKNAYIFSDGIFTVVKYIFTFLIFLALLRFYLNQINGKKFKLFTLRSYLLFFALAGLPLSFFVLFNIILPNELENDYNQRVQEVKDNYSEAFNNFRLTNLTINSRKLSVMLSSQSGKYNPSSLEDKTQIYRKIFTDPYYIPSGSYYDNLRDDINSLDRQVHKEDGDPKQNVDFDLLTLKAYDLAANSTSKYDEYLSANYASYILLNRPKDETFMQDVLVGILKFYTSLDYDSYIVEEFQDKKQRSISEKLIQNAEFDQNQMVELIKTHETDLNSPFFHLLKFNELNTNLKYQTDDIYFRLLIALKEHQSSLIKNDSIFSELEKELDSLWNKQFNEIKQLHIDGIPKVYSTFFNIDDLIYQRIKGLIFENKNRLSIIELKEQLVAKNEKYYCTIEYEGGWGGGPDIRLLISSLLFQNFTFTEDEIIAALNKPADRRGLVSGCIPGYQQRISERKQLSDKIAKLVPGSDYKSLNYQLQYFYDNIGDLENIKEGNLLMRMERNKERISKLLKLESFALKYSLNNLNSSIGEVEEILQIINENSLMQKKSRGYRHWLQYLIKGDKTKFNKYNKQENNYVIF